MIQDNFHTLQNKIKEIAKACGRDAGEIQIIAVSKTYPAEAVYEAMKTDQIHFGENKVQELVSKQALIPEIHWHMIGHLQSNKVKYIAPFIYLIHSIDSEKLLQTVQKEAYKNNRNINVLLQIFISGEASKSGMIYEEAENILKKSGHYPNIIFKGLMGMAALTEDEKVIRSQFKYLKECFERLSVIQAENIQFREISMGMSGDYPIAIEEGATLLRIGSALFGTRNYS